MVLLIIMVTGFFFLDNAVQKMANSFLDPLNPVIRAKVSSLDIDFSEGKATFSLSATNRNTNKKFLNVKEVVVDADWSTKTKVSVNDVDVTVTRKLLLDLQNLAPEEKEQKKETDTSSLPLSFLAGFELNNLTIKMPDASSVTSLEKMTFNFEEGSGLIANISGTFLPDNLLFLDIPEIDFDFSKDVFVAETKDISMTIKSPGLKISQSLLDTFQKQGPPSRQAQTAKSEESEEKKTSSLKNIFKQFRIENPELVLIGGTGLVSQMELLQINFQEGEGIIKNISSRFAGNSSPLISVDSIAIGFNPDGLMNDKANLAVNIDGTDITMNSDTASHLKGLPKPEKAPPKPEESPSLLTQVSKVTVDNTDIHLPEQGVITTIPAVNLNLNTGHFTMEKVNSLMVKNGKEFFKLRKISARFDPEKLTGPEKPEIKMIVSDFDLKVSKELLKSFKQKPESPKPQKSQEPQATPKSLPFVISRVLVGNSSISFLDFPGVGVEKYMTIHDIFGSIYNVSMEKGSPLSEFAFNATLEGDAKLLSEGKMDFAADPIQWSVNYKLIGLDMKILNDELRARIPLTYKEGVFNFYGEAIKQDEKIVGYYKPFLVDAKYLGDKKEFKGPKQFFAEIFATMTNWLFERDDTETVATRVPFVFEDGKMNTKVGEAAWNAVEHGLLETKKVKPGIEEKYHLKEAQEEK